MPEIFISYARSTEGEARRIAEALRGLGYAVWRDDELPAHRDYSEVIEERLRAAKAVVVVWSAEAVKSQWVRAEADIAREAGTLVQLTLDGAPLPLPFNRIQCADLRGWAGELAAPGWAKVVASVDELARGSGEAAAPATAPAELRHATPRKFTVGVAAFADPAGAAGGDDFGEGLAAEVATALARFHVLTVTDARPDARYVIEGAVRRAGTLARINLQLREASGARVWAERFEGELGDAFALQDEVAAAAAGRIEAAILTHETQAISARPVETLDAHELWLRARESIRRAGLGQVEALEEMATRAIAIEPGYAPMLALQAVALGFRIAFAGAGADTAPLQAAHKQVTERALAAGADDPEVLTFVGEAMLLAERDMVSARALVDRALEMNPGLVVGWDISANIRMQAGEYEDALARYRRCLTLDPKTPWRTYVWPGMAGCMVALGDYEDAIPLAREGLQIGAHNPWGMAALIAAYAHSGRLQEARAALEEFDPRQAGVFKTGTLGPELMAKIRKALELAGWADGVAG
ncbi:MAG TPA: TIR domain-containing protein [Caulobacteraceae bacterium]|nr:TIR domain-containing protein [Caulobacteraceae bacterium]